MYQVFRQFWVDGKIEEYYWGEWEDPNTANEVALELRGGACFSTVVRYVEKQFTDAGGGSFGLSCGHRPQYLLKKIKIFFRKYIKNT